MKKNKLYTANKWNQPAFMVDRQRHNIYDGLTWGQSSQMNNNPFGINLNAPTANTPKIDWSNPVQRSMALGQTNALTSSFGSDNPINLQQSNQMLSKTINPPLLENNNSNNGGLFGKNTLGVASGVASAISPMTSRLISDGYDTGGVGEGISSVGSAIGGAVGAVNPIAGAAISVGSSLFGGLYNRAFGVKTNQDRLNAANKVINQNQNYVFDGDLDNMPEIASATNTNAYKGGWFSGGKAHEKNEALAQRMAEGVDWANRSQENGVGNIMRDQISSSLRRISAFGGPLNIVDDGVGAINYGFMQDYLLNKKREAENKNKMLGMQQAPAFMPNSFAIGGDLQTNGSDYSVGKIYDVSEEEANRLKAMGYEFTVIN